LQAEARALKLPHQSEGPGAVVVHGSLSTKNVAELALKHGLPARRLKRGHLPKSAA
jgi:hypothetical protein